MEVAAVFMVVEDLTEEEAPTVAARSMVVVDFMVADFTVGADSVGREVAPRFVERAFAAAGSLAAFAATDFAGTEVGVDEIGVDAVGVGEDEAGTGMIGVGASGLVLVLAGLTTGMGMDLDTPIHTDIGTILGRRLTTITAPTMMIPTIISRTTRRPLTGIATTGTPIRHRPTLRRDPATGRQRPLQAI